MERHGVCGRIDQDSDSGEASNDFGVDPFPVCGDTSFAAIVEVHAVETCDGQGQDELEEAEQSSRDGADKAPVPVAGFVKWIEHCELVALYFAIRLEFEECRVAVSIFEPDYELVASGPDLSRS